jgi:hypothetical protein
MGEHLKLEMRRAKRSMSVGDIRVSWTSNCLCELKNSVVHHQFGPT